MLDSRQKTGLERVQGREENPDVVKTQCRLSLQKYFPKHEDTETELGKWVNILVTVPESACWCAIFDRFDSQIFVQSSGLSLAMEV